MWISQRFPAHPYSRFASFLRRVGASRFGQAAQKRTFGGGGHADLTKPFVPPHVERWHTEGGKLICMTMYLWIFYRFSEDGDKLLVRMLCVNKRMESWYRIIEWFYLFGSVFMPMSPVIVCDIWLSESEECPCHPTSVSSCFCGSGLWPLFRGRFGSSGGYYRRGSLPRARHPQTQPAQQPPPLEVTLARWRVFGLVIRTILILLLFTVKSQ